MDEVFSKLRIVATYGLLFSLFINLLMLTVPIYMMQVFDRVLASQSSDTLIFLTIIALFILIIFTVLDIARNKLGSTASDWLYTRLAVKALYHSPDVTLAGHRYGGQTLHDLQQLKQFVAGSHIFNFFDLPWLPLYLLLMFALHPALGAVTLLGALLLFLMAVVNELLTGSAYQKASQLSNQLKKETALIYKNAHTIQAMGMMGPIISRWLNTNQNMRQYVEHSSNKTALISAIAKGLRLSLQVLILATGAYFVTQNQLSAGTMIAASIIMGRALAPVEGAISTWQQWRLAKDAYHRLQHYFNYARQQNQSKPIDFPIPKGKLSCCQLSYVAPSHQALIKQINFEIRSGSMLAVIGSTGSGKSTLARLLAGSLAATGGEVRLDDVDMYQWPRAKLGAYVGFVSQDLSLFDVSIKENISRLAECDDEALIEAAKMADVYQSILKLPDGFDSQVGAQGVDLSLGEKQKIALARAFYQKPKLLILDDPAFALDLHGQTVLQRSLLAMKKAGATIVVMTHQSSMIAHADYVLVLNQGVAQHFGKKSEVFEALKVERKKMGEVG